MAQLKAPGATTWRLCREMRPYLWQLAALFALSLLATPFALLLPMPLKLAVDHVIGARPLPYYIDILLPDAIGTSDRALLMFTVTLLVGVTLLNQLRES